MLLNYHNDESEIALPPPDITVWFSYLVQIPRVGTPFSSFGAKKVTLEIEINGNGGSIFRISSFENPNCVNV